MTRKQMIDALVDAKYPGGGKETSRKTFRAALEEQSDAYIKMAHESIHRDLFTPEKFEQESSATPETPRGKCPRCGYTCLPSTKQLGKFYCGVCTEADGGTPFYF